MSTHPEDAPTAGSRPLAPVSPWIVGAWQDLILFVATPLLIIPLVFGLEQIWRVEALYLGVAAFGALGHHLPGMMRAYGDRALFARFRTRFILAPLLLIAVCVAFSRKEFSPVVFLTYCWGVWHGLMQTHGFLRIYDAKMKSFGRWTARLDQLMCLSWFVSGVLFSPTRLHFLLTRWYAGHGPYIQSEWVTWLQWGWLVFTGGVTVAFFVNLAHDWRQGRYHSFVKLLLLVISISFWWYTNVMVKHILVGLLMFEIFHDVQYLSIVWLFNRKRVDGGENVGGFTKFLFRRSGALLGLYVGCVFAYGALYFFPKRIENLEYSALRGMFGGVLAASALLHFYFDGFIWKVREASTRSGLGLAGGKEDRNVFKLGMPMWTRHALKWGLFLVPALFFGWRLQGEPVPRAVQFESMAEISHEDPSALYNLAALRQEQGRHEEAVAIAREALAMNPPRLKGLDEKLPQMLGWNLVESGCGRIEEGETEAGQRFLDEAYGMQPHYPDILVEKSRRLALNRQYDKAERYLKAAVAMNPAHTGSQFYLALVHREQGRFEDALRHARRALELAPESQGIHDLVTELESLPGS